MGTLAVEATGGRRRWSPILGAALALVLLASQLPLYGRPAEEWSRIKYGERYLFATRLAREIDGLLAPGESFYLWYSEPTIYFASRRSPPTGMVTVRPLVYGPLTATLTARVLTDLERTSPELLVILAPSLHRPWRHHPVLAWFAERYRPLPGDPVREELVALYVRRGGELDRRLARAGRP